MKKILLTLIIVLFASPVFAKNAILIEGDSLSAGYGVPSGKGWVALLTDRLDDKAYDYSVVNSSISGDTTSNGLGRLAQDLQTNKPKITIIELGGNDGLRGLPLKVIQDNLSQMIDLAKAAGSQVILLGVRLPPSNGQAYTDQFHAIYTNLGNDKDVSVVPFFLNGVDDKPTLMQPDRIHPKEEAQGILLDNVWPALSPMLK